MYNGHTKKLLNLDECRDSITCPLCLSECKDPKLLECFHTFCGNCLKELENKVTHKITCPLCRRFSQLPTGGVDDLPSNYYIEALKQSKTTETRICEACIDNKPASKHCIDCEQLYCYSCFLTHQTIKIAKSHRVVSVDDSEGSQSCMTHKIYCTKHSQEELRFYCYECRQSICRDCKLTKHEGHKSDDLTEIAKETLQSVREFSESLEVDIMFVANRKRTLSDLEDYLKKENTNVRVEIQKKTKLMHKAVDRASNKLKNNLTIRKTNELTRINQEIQKLDHASNSLKALSRHAQNVLQFGTAADTMQARDFVNGNKCNPLNEVTGNTFEISLPALNMKSKVLVKTTDIGDLTWQSKDFKLTSVTCSLVRNICVSSSSNISVGSIRSSLQHKGYMWVCLRSPIRNTIWRNLLLFSDKGNCSKSMLLSNVYDFVAMKDDFLVLCCLNAIQKITTQMLNQPETEEHSKSKTDNAISMLENQHLCSSVPISVSRDIDDNIVVLQLGNVIRALSPRDLSEVYKFKPQFLVSPCRVVCAPVPSRVLAIADPGAEAVFIFNAYGTLQTRLNPSDKFPIRHPFYPCDLCFSPTGHIIVADYQNHCVFVINKDYTQWNIVLWRRYISYPTAVALDGMSRLWVGHSGHQISVFGLDLP